MGYSESQKRKIKPALNIESLRVKPWKVKGMKEIRRKRKGIYI